MACTSSSSSSSSSKGLRNKSSTLATSSSSSTTTTTTTTTSKGEVLCVPWMLRPRCKERVASQVVIICHVCIRFWPTLFSIELPPHPFPPLCFKGVEEFALLKMPNSSSLNRIPMSPVFLLCFQRCRGGVLYFYATPFSIASHPPPLLDTPCFNSMESFCRILKCHTPFHRITPMPPAWCVLCFKGVEESYWVFPVSTTTNQADGSVTQIQVS